MRVLFIVYDARREPKTDRYCALCQRDHGINNRLGVKGKIMGDYTRFEFNAKLRQDTPQEVVAVLRYMLDGGSDDDETPESIVLPTHPLFLTERWSYMFCCTSSYHPDTLSENGAPRPSLEQDTDGLRLKVLSSFKNYDNEVRLFCDWIAPYLDEADGVDVGTTQFEAYDTATRLFKDRGVIVFLETDNPDEPYDGYSLLHV